MILYHLFEIFIYISIPIVIIFTMNTAFKNLPITMRTISSIFLVAGVLLGGIITGAISNTVNLIWNNIILQIMAWIIMGLLFTITLITLIGMSFRVMANMVSRHGKILDKATERLEKEQMEKMRRRYKI